MYTNIKRVSVVNETTNPVVNSNDTVLQRVIGPKYNNVETATVELATIDILNTSSIANEASNETTIASQNFALNDEMLTTDGLANGINNSIGELLNNENFSMNPLSTTILPTNTTKSGVEQHQQKFKLYILFCSILISYLLIN